MILRDSGTVSLVETVSLLSLSTWCYPGSSSLELIVTLAFTVNLGGGGGEDDHPTVVRDQSMLSRGLAEP